MITVYTCATNSRDSLREDQCAEDARFVAYVDREPGQGGVWEYRPASQLFDSPRRNARTHKILAHQFIDTAYSIWMDANVALRAPARELVDAYLGDADIAVFWHRSRWCTYKEAERCRLLGLDRPDIIDEQIQAYEQAGLARGLGLAETTVVIRRHTDDIQKFNNAWWSEICRHSLRDQISFMYVAQRSGVKVNYIKPTKYLNPYFSITNRPAGLESTSPACADSHR